MTPSDPLSRLRSELSARDAMIEEMDHRVKNHLQLLASYARSLARQPGETAAHVASEIAMRLSMVAAIHDALHMTRDKEAVLASIFLPRVCMSLFNGDNPIRVQCDQGLSLDAEELAPIGMIVVEAVCNSLKHGFPSGRAGAVTVTFRQPGLHRILQISDDGVGLPVVAVRSGSGLRLIEAFARRLRGALDISPNGEGGATVRLTLPAARQGVPSA
jgi:two-component sensor histidine kinase